MFSVYIKFISTILVMYAVNCILDIDTWRNYTALQNLKIEYKYKGRGQLLCEQARKILVFDPGYSYSQNQLLNWSKPGWSVASYLMFINCPAISGTQSLLFHCCIYCCISIAVAMPYKWKDSSEKSLTVILWFYENHKNFNMKYL